LGEIVSVATGGQADGSSGNSRRRAILQPWVLLGVYRKVPSQPGRRLLEGKPVCDSGDEIDWLLGWDWQFQVLLDQHEGILDRIGACDRVRCHVRRRSGNPLEFANAEDDASDE
jgi:hypothetical protein